MAQAEEVRRVWNWPMKVAVLSLAVFGLTGRFCLRLERHHGAGGLVETLGVLQIIALALGLSSLVVYLVGSLSHMARDLRPENRPAAAVDLMDTTQRLILEGKKSEAVRFYQEQNRVSLSEAEEIIAQIETSLKAGLRV